MYQTTTKSSWTSSYSTGAASSGPKLSQSAHAPSPTRTSVASTLTTNSARHPQPDSHPVGNSCGSSTMPANAPRLLRVWEATKSSAETDQPASDSKKSPAASAEAPQHTAIANIAQPTAVARGWRSISTPTTAKVAVPGTSSRTSHLPSQTQMTPSVSNRIAPTTAPAMASTAIAIWMPRRTGLAPGRGLACMRGPSRGGNSSALGVGVTWVAFMASP